ncbi:MAG: hypothetical protein HFF53_03025 [Lawsonibacter sp.]|nr:hypothetical protein [Lawsonibacter sp.]
MKKLTILLCSLLCLTTLAGCGSPSGGVSSWVESSASQPTAQPAQSVPDASLPDVSVPPEDSSQPEEEPAASEPQSARSTPEPAVTAPETKPESAPEPAVTAPETKPETKPEPAGSTPESAPAPEPEPQPETPAATKETASAYIGRSVSSLIAAIGSPSGSDYTPSCQGDGEDGELFYDGFTVYTYRENGTEIVQDVV